MNRQHSRQRWSTSKKSPLHCQRRAEDVFSVEYDVRNSMGGYIIEFWAVSVSVSSTVVLWMCYVLLIACTVPVTLMCSYPVIWCHIQCQKKKKKNLWRTTRKYNLAIRITYFLNSDTGYMCRITMIFETLKDGSLLINIFLNQTIVLAAETSSKWCRRFFKITWRLFWQETENFILFGLSNNVQILLAIGISTCYTCYGIINGFWLSMSAFATVIDKEIPYRHINLLHGLLSSSFFMFPWLRVKVQNTICYSLLFLPHVSKIWTKLDYPKYTKFGSLWQNTCLRC